MAQLVKGGYWPDYVAAALPVSQVDTSLYTHVYFAFVLVSSVTYELSITDNNRQLLQSFAAGLHDKSPPAKAMLSIGGGGNFDPNIFSQMARSQTTRSAFIQSTIAAARTYDLDGFDIDWEYPGTTADMDNLGLLFQEWRAAIATDAQDRGRAPLLLTAAVRHTPTFLYWVTGVRVTYPVQAIRDHVDWINLMCYDYHGAGWEPNTTGAHAELNNTTRDGVAEWLRLGVPAEKLVLGMPLYARSWQLVNANNNGIGSPASGAGPGDDGTLAYNDLADFNVQNGATVVYDARTVSMYSYAGTSWFSYDDTESVTEKIRFASGSGLRGHFFWSLGQDLDWRISRAASDAWDT